MYYVFLHLECQLSDEHLLCCLWLFGTFVTEQIRLQHEVYPDNTFQASRQVLVISDLEIRDRLALSKINKFLYQYCSDAIPRQSHASMVWTLLLTIFRYVAKAWTFV